MTDGVNGNNFIEYSSSGQAILEVSAGSLIVGSQVRRSNFSQTGILKYRQTGGDVSIGRNNFPKVNNRGVFEILNAGSEFTHTAGSFTIEKDNGSTTVASLWLEPEIFNFAPATTITLGANSTPTNTNFGVRITEYINNLTIDNVSGGNPRATLFTIPLSLDGKLLISSGSTFDANGRNLNFRGNNVAAGTSLLENNGAFNANQNLTTFTVTDTKQITGASNTVFYDFTNNGNGTLELTTDGGADNDVRMLSGIFATGTQRFVVLGDIFHDAVHTSNAPANVGTATEHGIIMANTTTRQTIQRTSTGSSTFGSLVIKNANDVRIPDNDYEFFISEKLRLNTGKLDIGGNLLTFLTSATDIENAIGATAIGNFSENNMIQTNSSIKDFGVKKLVLSGADSYVFPVGQLKYTPVQIDPTTLTSASGFFLVRPVNDKPLGIVEDDESDGGVCGDPEIVDEDNVLNYYWIVKSQGITNFSTANTAGNGMSFFYDDSNLPTLPTPQGYTIDNMGPAKLLTAFSFWDKEPMFNSDFDETNNEIVFHFSNEISEDVTGIYTAGITLENNGTDTLCGGAIPSDVPLFITIGGVTEPVAEDEFDESVTNVTWTNSDIPANGPRGADILVKTGFTLILDNPSIGVRLRKTTLEPGATIRIMDTENHNLGFVEGEGTIELMSSGDDAKLPTGDYEEFFPSVSGGVIDCSKRGSLTYSGVGSYSVMTELSAVYNLNMLQSGNRIFPNNNFLVCNDFTIDESGTGLRVDNTQFNKDMEVKGDMIRLDGKFLTGSGTARISLTGTALQRIDGSFIESDSTSFNNLVFNNGAGFTVVNAGNDDVEVRRRITLTNGVVNTDANNSFTLKLNGTILGGNNNTHIDGPFRRVLGDNNQPYRMPLGDDGIYGQLDIVDPTGFGSSGTGIKIWEGEYYKETPPNPYSIDVPVRTSLNEFWRVNDGLNGSGTPQARIRLYYNSSSDVQDPTNLRIAHSQTFGAGAIPFASITWESKNPVELNATPSYATAPSVTFSQRLFTFATTDIVNTPLPVTLISFEGFQNEDVVELQWATAVEINNSHFIVEKLGANNDFYEIGRVEGSGDSKSRINYQSFDTEPIVGSNYYRLKQVDFDGKSTNSRVVEVNFVKNGEVVEIPISMELFPNPVDRGELNIRLQGFVNSEKSQVQIFDLMGREVFRSTMEIEKQFSAEKAFTIPTLPTGIYIVKVADGKQSLAKRIVIR